MDKQTFDSYNDFEQKKMNSQLAKSFLDKALHDFQKDKLKKQIDDALKNQDKDEFLRLTEQLKNFY